MTIETKARIACGAPSTPAAALTNLQLAQMVAAAGGDAWQEGATAQMEGDHVFRLTPDTMRSLLASAKSETTKVPPGFALVPLRMTPAMRRATEEEGWEWADLLVAAVAVDDDQYETSLRNEPSRAEMREVLLANGFAMEDGCADLKDHVYEAAYAVLAIAQPDLPSERVWPKEVTPEMIEAFKTSFTDGSISTDRLTCAIQALLKAAPSEPTSRTERDLRDLLEEVRNSFTRDDDLPGDLLPRIDAALDSNAAVASVR